MHLLRNEIRNVFAFGQIRYFAKRHLFDAAIQPNGCDGNSKMPHINQLRRWIVREQHTSLYRRQIHCGQINCRKHILKCVRHQFQVIPFAGKII